MPQFSRKDKDERIEQVCKQLRFLDRINVKILFLSGGEKKRLSIAEELLNDPRVLVCDEPTSGLDSHMAEQVLHILLDLSKESRKTIIFSVHQPSARVFAVFQNLMFMAKGKCV